MVSYLPVYDRYDYEGIVVSKGKRRCGERDHIVSTKHTHTRKAPTRVTKRQWSLVFFATNDQLKLCTYVLEDILRRRRDDFHFESRSSVPSIRAKLMKFNTTLSSSSLEFLLLWVSRKPISQEKGILRVKYLQNRYDEDA